jgi:hypothetical protein
MGFLSSQGVYYPTVLPVHVFDKFHARVESLILHILTNHSGRHCMHM